MKLNIVLLALFTLVIFGCKTERKVEIRFCADIRANNPCIGEDSVFYHGTNVWAQLLLYPGFKGTEITGNIYFFENEEKVLIEGKKYEIKQGKTIIMDMMFFYSCGNYVVEFIDDKGNILAEKNLELY